MHIIQYISIKINKILTLFKNYLLLLNKTIVKAICLNNGFFVWILIGREEDNVLQTSSTRLRYNITVRCTLNLPRLLGEVARQSRDGEV